MKILVVSMRSLHTIRWLSQLKHSEHEVHYFDILNGGYINELNWVIQHTNWRYKFGDFKGRVFIKKHLPGIHKLLENDVEKKFKEIIEEVQPDLVHSFVMYLSCVPILNIMKQNKHVKWLYSAWGNDLYYYRNIPEYKKDIIKTLPQIDYMFADCERDIKIASEMGFKGISLGVFPGGGGYEINKYKAYIKPVSERNVILLKGYEQRFGKAVNVVKALIKIKHKLLNYKVVIFGADDDFYAKYKLISNTSFIDVKGKLAHNKVLELMGKSLIYIGNSVSDGMPNTLLEAIIMEAFPIQSNPGGASAEMIKDGVNGFLIDDCESIETISQKIMSAISNTELLEKAAIHNKQLRQELADTCIKPQVLKKYSLVENEMKK